MLIYSENRYISTETNMMIIRARDNIGYYYVHRGLYNQAVILDYKFSDDYLDLCEVITGERKSRPDVDRFVVELPTPINILGCFLLLVEEELEDLLDMVGAIHVMSNSIDYSKYITVPAEMRASVSFSLSIREEYELPWDRFLKESIPWSEDFFTRRDAIPMSGTLDTPDEVEEEGELSNIGDDGIDYGDPITALLMGCSDDIFDMPTDEEEEEEEEVEPESVTPVVATAPVVTPTAETIPEPVPASEIIDTVVSQPKVTSGLDFLRGLGKR